MKNAAANSTAPQQLPLAGIEAMRERARTHLEHGAVTDDYDADRLRVIGMLNEALATELVCMLRYKRHFFMAAGIHAAPVAAEFSEHAADELGGEPDFSPHGLAVRSHAEYVEGDTLKRMIEEDLIAERVAIESYRQMIDYLGSHDTTTRRMLESVLASEEEHAEDLSSLLKGMTDYGKV
jgi:bacterioferritin